MNMSMEENGTSSSGIIFRNANLSNALVGYIETAQYSGYENKPKRQVYFLRCESCFWCAAPLSSSLPSSSSSSSSSSSTPSPHFVMDETIAKCPLCGDNGIRLIPISRGQQI
jgi:hypothetical protein